MQCSVFEFYQVPKKYSQLTSLQPGKRPLLWKSSPWHERCENHAWLPASWHYSAMLEAYPVNFNACQPATSSSIFSGENYKAQSIQMCPTKLNTSLSDKQPLLSVTLHTGNLALQIALEGQQRGVRLHRRQIRNKPPYGKCHTLEFSCLTHTPLMLLGQFSDLI